MRDHIGWVCVWLATASSLLAAPVDFATHIRPLFEQHCAACHGEQAMEGGLRLDSRAWVFRGGDSGEPGVKPGSHQDSRIWQVISGADPDLKMPPPGEGEPLSAEQVQHIAEWIDAGAAWPDHLAGSDPAAAAREHWSFRPLQRPTLPRFQGEWATNSLDTFILAKLQTEGLAPSQPALPEVFLRRLYLDVLGLIPSPAEVQEFLADRAPDARDRWVDRVLADPRYGERWGQHWLDILRYADTDGFEVNTPRPNAWPFRDYVIAAFNHDIPYARFVTEQLLGDQLGVDPAMGFLVCAAALLPGQIGADDVSKKIARQDELDEIVSGTCSALLGLTVGCARCHHHKFDPISQHDYYSLQAVFSGVRFGERDWSSEAYRQAGPPLEAELKQLQDQLNGMGFLPAITAKENVERFTARPARWIRFTVLATNSLEPCLDEMEVFRASEATTNGSSASDARCNVALATLGAKATSSGNYPDATQHRIEHIHDGQFGNARSWISSEAGKGWIQIELPQVESIDEIVWQRDRNGQFSDRTPTEYRIDVATEPDKWTTIASSTLRLTGTPQVAEGALELIRARHGGNLPEEFEAQLSRILAQHSQIVEKLVSLRATFPGKVFAGRLAPPETIFVLQRGDVLQPQSEAKPNGLAMFRPLHFESVQPTDPERRAGLAKWITARDNPLAARVLVNRLWQYHFGVGIVDTPSDFGNQGSRPTHPELLDWLAVEFLDHDGSIKHMHRLILCSKTFGQDSRVRAEAFRRDTDNRWLWRYTSRRVEAEVLRDALLTASGELQGKMGGPGFDVFESRGGLNGFPPIESFGSEGLRRMVYAHKVRMERDPVFGAFDCPDAGQACPKRSRSTTALQALNLFNSPFVMARAEQFAQRIVRAVGDDRNAQITLAFQITMSRSPREAERTLIDTFMETHDLAALGRALFNTNEFVFIP